MWFQTVAVTAAELPLVCCRITIECFPSPLSTTLLLSNADSAAVLYTVYAGLAARCRQSQSHRRDETHSWRSAGGVETSAETITTPRTTFTPHYNQVG